MMEFPHIIEHTLRRYVETKKRSKREKFLRPPKEEASRRRLRFNYCFSVSRGGGNLPSDDGALVPVAHTFISRTGFPR